ncbi:Highly reducing polyketide synthase azaB [Paramyrothecium foliicola]|nr:Highly reducing polyketide synthase azaB [Paramyrothecium foliicola]
MGSLPSNSQASRLEADILPPLAIIGMSFRFPQDAVDAASFWNMLLEKRCASTEVPAERFNINAHYHPDREQLESSTVRNGHFLTGDLGAWDAPFFNITATEADAMDPGQRLTLEVAFRALENAGIPLDSVAGTKTSVYSATFMRDYDCIQNNDPDVQTKYKGIGSAPNMLSNRVSWFFDMRGPSGSVDTACSSSLLALDLVCQSIWSGDANMGLACGNNIMLTPYTTISLDNLGLLGKDGRCFSFDHRANGYARGEGVGVIVVKPLDTALRDGDTIRAVIRSSCSNQDGKTPAISQPSREAQERLILDAHAKAGLGLGTTRYFEAHGTGTPVGDPIETSSIGTAYRKYRSQADPLYVGSVKSNIGHLEGAAGVAGVIKVVLALEAGVIPPQTNFEKLNSAIDTEFLNIKIPTEAVPWPTQGLRRASVQSFGIGGANSHVILDDAYNFLRDRGLKAHHNTVPIPPLKAQSLIEVLQDVTMSTSLKTLTNGVSNTNGTEASEVLDFDFESQSQLLVWSTADEAGIKRMVNVWKSYLSNLPISAYQKSQFIKDMAHTLATRRTHFPHRAFAVVGLPEELSGLGHQISPALRGSASPKLGYIFTGQGSQWYAMGRELFHRFPVYRNSLIEASVYLQGLGCSWDAVEELMRDEVGSNVNDAEFSQPLCTIIQIALVDLLDSFGLRPCKVVGHSSGEIAAAYCAGALSRHTAWKISFLRGFLASQLTSATSGKQSKIQGAMMAVGLSATEVERHLEKVAHDLGSKRLVIACVNSPLNVTISGEESHIDHLKNLLDAVSAGVFARKLKVKLAYHSFQMLEVADEYLFRMGQFSPPPIPPSSRHFLTPVMASSVTGTWINRDELAKAEYWVQNLVSPVLFSDALATLCASPDAQWKGVNKKLDGSHAKTTAVTELVEIGPHAVMKGPTREILRSIGKEKAVHYVSALVRNRSATTTILELAGRLHCLGHKVNLEQVNSSNMSGKTSMSGKVLTTLPEYPFNHSKSYWSESRLSKAFRFRKSQRHDLLGAQSFDWNPLEARWRHFIRVPTLPWTDHHKINGTTLYPAAGMLVMAIEAARQLADSSLELSAFLLRDVSFHSALSIPDGSEGVEVNLHVRPRKESGDKDAGWFDFRLYRHDPSNSSSWNEVCNGSIQLLYKGPTSISSDADDDMGVSHESQAWENLRLHRAHRIKANCAETTEPSKLYQKLAASGYQYGPAFQGITDLSYDGLDATVATVQTYQWSRHFEGADPGSDHIVHPTTLDTILHTMLAVLTCGGSRTIATTIPTFAERIWISAGGGLSSTKADSITVFTTSGKSGLRESHSSLIVTDTECQTVLIDVENFQTTAVAANNEGSETDKPKIKPGYTLDWKPDLSLLSPGQFEEFFQEVSTNMVSEPKDWHDTIDQFIMTTLIRTLNNMHANNLPFNKNAKYTEWMRLQVNKFQQSDRTPLADEVFQHTARILTDGDNQARLFSAIALDHVSLLTDENRLELLPPLETLGADYFGQDGLASCMASVTTLIDAMAHKSPDLCVLELGAGLFSLTDQILKTLSTRENGSETSPTPRFARYDYTAPLPDSLPAAKANFGTFTERVNFAALDIAQDLQGQDFELGKYDLIVASGVLQILASPIASLNNIRKLLKPGGKFIHVQPARKDEGLRTNFLFGLHQRWWSESNFPPHSGPCLSEESWKEAYRESGFSDHLILRNSQSATCRELSVMVSTNALAESHLSEDVAVSKTPKNALSFIYNDDEPEQEYLANELAELFGDSTNGNFAVVHALSFSSAVEMPVRDNAVLVFLLELGAPVWSKIEEPLYSQLQKLLTTNMAAKMLWIGQHCPHRQEKNLNPDQPAYRLIDGLSRVLNSEVDGEILNVLSLEKESAVTKQQLNHIVSVINKITNPVDEFPDTEWREKNGWLCIPRMVQSATLNHEISSRTVPRHEVQRPWYDGSKPDGGDPLKLILGTPGLLNTLHFIEDTDHSNTNLAEDEVEIRVQAVGLNYRDVLISLGRLQNAHVGCECAGVVTAVGTKVDGLSVGDRVAALAPYGCYRTYLRVDHRFAARIPDSTTFTVAAAMVINHYTAWSTLHELGRLAPGETVLVHSAAGGTGQAAVQVAQHVGAQVLATAGTPKKKAALTELYGISPEHIFSSRDATAFSRGVQRTTDNRGVDLVLNALSGESLLASWDCLAPFGRFMEIGKRDIHARKNLPMAHFDRGVSFQGFDISVVCKTRPNAIRPMLEELFKLHEEGVLKPASPLQVFGISELEKVFRTMQRGETMGKIVVEMRSEDIVKAVLDRKPSTTLRSDATYLIAGGLGGLGRSMARWLVDRGARNLILLARSGIRTQGAKDFVQELQSRGIIVATPPCDISDADALQVVLAECAEKMPPVRGAIQATMVLRDAIFMGMTHDVWQAATVAKVQGSWNMHTLLPPDMDFFIGLSSVAGVAGGRGQANYAAGNTYIDALMDYRVSQGQHGVALDLGAFLDVGFVLESSDLQARWESSRAMAPTEADLFALLDCYCSGQRAPTQAIFGISGYVGDKSTRHYFRKPMLRTLALEGENAEKHGADGAGTPSTWQVDFDAVFSKADSLDDAAAAVNEALLRKLASTLALTREELDPDTPLHTYGVDSLVAVELRNWFVKEVHAELAIFDILGSATTRTASRLAAAKTRFKKGGWSEAES